MIREALEKGTAEGIGYVKAQMLAWRRVLVARTAGDKAMHEAVFRTAFFDKPEFASRGLAH
jgi:hypothetical protein